MTKQYVIYLTASMVNGQNWKITEIENEIEANHRIAQCGKGDYYSSIDELIATAQKYPDLYGGNIKALIAEVC